MKGIIFNVTLLLGLLGGSVSFAQTPVITPAAYANGIQPNYIRTWDAVIPTKDASRIKPGVHTDSFRMSTQYLDGLGRPVQMVIKQGSLVTGGPATDMVNAIVYDGLGRETYKYLPFAANNTGSNTSVTDGLFKWNPFQQDSSFNKSQFPDESFYYAKVNAEFSPLSRPQENFAPGNSWAGTITQSSESNRRSIKMKYWINTSTDSVRLWRVTNVSNDFGTYASPAMYGAGLLFKTISADEAGSQVIEFKDMGGKLILKKVQLGSAADTGLGKGHSGWLNTYYIYDGQGLLRAVVQPKGVELLASNSWAFTSDILSEQCFRYEYDNRLRMAMKKVPGAGAVIMVYDQRDRVVMIQDSFLRENHKWNFNSYDELNRLNVSGMITDNSYYNNPGYHRALAAASSAYPNIGSYTNEVLSKTFYDDYSWRSAESNPLSDTRSTSYDSYLLTASNTTWPYPQAVSQSNQLRGLPTGSKIKILESSDYLYAVNFYDQKARSIQSQSQNITGGTDILATQFAFPGMQLLTILKSEKSGTNSQTSIILTRMTYDLLGRQTKLEKKISNTKVNSGSMPGSWKTIADNSYNALGQLKTKRLGTALDSAEYEFNIRGWMLGVNRDFVKDTTMTTHYFGFDLGYDKTQIIVNETAKSYAAAQYNGNITGMLWRSTGDDQLRKYDFSYDAVNRLTGAAFTQFNNSNFSVAAGVDFTVSGITYDANGNLSSMMQRGLKLNTSSLIDSFSYNYNTGTNRLKNVIDLVNDTATRLGDFRSSKAYMTALSNNKTSAAVDYLYDGNGNMIKDKNKDIESISYNHLNLPKLIHVQGKGNIIYTYDATGNKLKKQVVDSTVSPVKVTSTLYCFGNYVNDTLQFMGHEEGRIRLKGDSVFMYDYFLKDHLGNIRMVLTEEQEVNAYPVASLETTPLATERLYYSGVDTGRTNKSSVTDYPSDTYTSPNDYIQDLRGDGNKIGTGITLRVMAGDKVNLRVNSWWKSASTPGTPSNPLTSLLGILNSSISAASGGKVSSSVLSGGSILSPGITGFLNSQGSYNTAKPKAFINWVLFDEQFKYVASGSGFEQVGASNTFTTHTRSNLAVNKNGFIYIYVSNETPNIDVYFDNLQVTHTKGPLLEETHYYPFGLTMEGISSKTISSLENKKKWNASSELNTNFDLYLYETFFRSLDPQIGRFWQIDPKCNLETSSYSAMGNNPILLNDPLGDTTRIQIGDHYYNLQRNNDGGISYYDEKGKLYEGKLDAFSQSVLDAANKIAGIKDGEVQSRLTEVLTGEKIITVAEGLNSFDKETGTLSWFDQKNGINTTNGGNIEKRGAISKHKRDSDLELVHELLGHGFQYSKGMLNNERMLPFYQGGHLIGFAKKVEADASSIVTRAAEASGRGLMGQPIYVEQLKYPNGDPAQLLFHVIPRGYLLTNSDSQKPSNYRR